MLFYCIFLAMPSLSSISFSFSFYHSSLLIVYRYLWCSISSFPGFSLPLSFSFSLLILPAFRDMPSHWVAVASHRLLFPFLFFAFLQQKPTPTTYARSAPQDLKTSSRLRWYRPAKTMPPHYYPNTSFLCSIASDSLKRTRNSWDTN